MCVTANNFVTLQSIREMLCECGLRLGKASKLDFSLDLHHPCNVKSVALLKIPDNAIVWRDFYGNGEWE